VENPFARQRHVYAVCAYTWHNHVSGKEIGFLLFAGFWQKFLPQLNIKAVHNFKKKSLGIILIAGVMLVEICTVLGF